jgi:hypothetical protein
MTMRRWVTFLSGVVVGGLLLYGVLSFHILHASDGMHLVPKIDAQLAGTYVDIRDFTPRDWIAHPEILAALQKAGRIDLIELAADDAIRVGLDRVLGPRKPDK